jgi:hypothetical protein
MLRKTQLVGRAITGKPMTKELADAALRQAREVLARQPDLPHRWEQHGNDQELTFFASESTGFDVTVCFTPESVIVFARGAHRHFELIDGKDVESIAAEALGMVRDLLSPDMRVREYRASGSPYRWDIEIYTPDGWKTTESTGLILWNYFGRRSQQVFQNQILPGRLSRL